MDTTFIPWWFLVIIWLSLISLIIWALLGLLILYFVLKFYFKIKHIKKKLFHPFEEIIVEIFQWFLRLTKREKKDYLEILKRRYARGELTKEEFENLKKDLED